MEITQKKGRNKYTFSFGDDKLNYAYQEKSGKGDVDIYYGDIPKKTSEFIEENEWLRNVGALWLLLGIGQTGYSTYLEGALKLDLLWIVVGALCLMWSQLSKITYTVYRTEEANLFVIQDGKHDDVVKELMTRRKKQLLDWYADINMDNTLPQEINKFKWLSEQGVLTEEESKQKIEEAKFYHQSDSNQERLLN